MRRTPCLALLAAATFLGSLLGPISPARATTTAAPATWSAPAATATRGAAPATARRIPRTGMSPFIIGGTPVAEGQFPFLALLLLKDPNGPGYGEYCGGTLIAEQWVLTAAHCVTGDAPASPSAVLIGRMVASDTTVGDFNAPGPSPGSVFVDPAWNPTTLEHDAALIHLAAPSFEPEIHIVDDSQDNLMAADTQASVIGVGQTNAQDKTSGASTVQIAPQTVLSDADCTMLLGGDFRADTMLCAGQPNVGPCFGDSGGPLFATTAAGQVEIGVVSHGAQMCATTPSVYTRVSAERAWIRQTIAAVPGPVNRLAGADRDSTAVAISASSFAAAGSASAVILANRNSFADAIPGAPLAVAKSAPLLLTAADSLDPVTAAEIQRVLTPGATVYLLGGQAALSAAIESSLGAMGYAVVRYGGANRFSTAVAIANLGLGDPSRVLEATGRDFPDALAGGAAAASAHAAILLTDGPSQAPETAAYLAAHPSDTVTALGGAAATADPSATALAGGDRYATSVLVAQAFFAHPSMFAVADGLDFPDALAGGVNIGARGGPLLLVPPGGPLPPSEVAWFNTTSPTLTTGTAYGGPNAVAPAVLGELVMLIS